MSHTLKLAHTTDLALIDTLTPSLKRTIDAALVCGLSKREILAQVRRAAGGKRTLVVLAVEAYIGAKQSGEAM